MDKVREREEKGERGGKGAGIGTETVTVRVKQRSRKHSPIKCERDCPSRVEKREVPSGITPAPVEKHPSR